MVASSSVRLKSSRHFWLGFAAPVLMLSGLACSSKDSAAGAAGGAQPVATGGASSGGSSSGGSPSASGNSGSALGGAGASSGGAGANGGGAGANGGGAGANSGGASGGTIGSGGASGGSNDPVDARALVSALGFGTNIGNTLENTVAWETGWSEPLITQAFIHGLVTRGIKTVRVPVAWDTYAVNGVIDPTKMARVKEVVNWIIGEGMYAIVNIHWDGGWIDNEKGTPAYTLTPAIKTKFASYWQQIGTAFSGVGHKLILEGMNEEGRWTTDGMAYGTPDIPPLNEMNQLFVTTARAQGGFNATRALLIAGFNTDLQKTCVPAFTVPTDPAGTGKLFLSIHYYTPWTFTIKEDNTDQPPLSTTWGTADEKKALDDLFTQLGTCSTDKKIPIILGEFGVTVGTAPFVRESASRIAWMTAVAKACKSRGIVPVLWDTGSEISRTDGAFSSDFQQAFDAAK
ncbi:MAG: glycoside hydrolase family 5 protein [Polyangiaceae bacterium]